MRFILIIGMIVCLHALQAQSYLELTHKGWLFNHTYTISAGDNIAIKRKDGTKLRSARIVSVTERVLVSEDGRVFPLTQISKIRFYADRHLVESFRKFFVRLGIAFAGLNTLNQAITGNQPVFQPVAFYIGGGLVAVGLAFRAHEYRHLKMNHRVKIKLVEKSFNKLNEQESPEEHPD